MSSLKSHGIGKTMHGESYNAIKFQNISKAKYTGLYTVLWII